MIGYGLLYMKHLMPILETLFIMINVVILLVMEAEAAGVDKNAFLGVKIFMGMSLLYLRLETLRKQLSNLRKPNSQKIQPEIMSLHHDK